MLEEADACVVLPLREAVAHFAFRNARSTEAEMGGSKHGNTHASIDISTCLGIGFLLFFGKQGGKFLQQSFGSSPRKPSVDTTKGEKCRGCSRQFLLFFVFFGAG
jgi:hypothetical protein